MSVGCILVFDVTNISSFVKVKKFILTNIIPITYRNARGRIKNAGKFYIIGDTAKCDSTLFENKKATHRQI